MQTVNIGGFSSRLLVESKVLSNWILYNPLLFLYGIDFAINIYTIINMEVEHGVKFK